MQSYKRNLLKGLLHSFFLRLAHKEASLKSKMFNLHMDIKLKYVHIDNKAIKHVKHVLNVSASIRDAVRTP